MDAGPLSANQTSHVPAMTRQRVVIVCPLGLRGAGGISRAVSYFTDAWKGQTDAPEYKVVDPRGAGRLLWSPFYLLRTLAIVLGEFTFGNADILHINIASNGSTLRKSIIVFVAALVSAPYILHLHGAGYHIFFGNLPRPLKAVVRMMFGRATRVIVLGERWRDFVCDDIGIDPERVVIMHNAVPAPDISRRIHTNGPCRILFLGRLGARKGVPELLQALATEHVQGLPWTAIFAGDGDAEYYKKMAADLGLGERIEFPGWVGPEAVSAYLKSMDIMVLPSYNEGLSMSVLEGMAHGLAVVTTPVGATPEAIDDGVSGLLVAPGDTDALAGALARVIEDTGLRYSLSRAAIQKCAECFDVQVYARRMTQLYRRCRVEHHLGSS